MKFAKVENEIIVDVIIGNAPEDYVEVLKKWDKPVDFPLEFYVTGSTEPILSIVGSEVQEKWTFILKSVEQIKDVIYNRQKKDRYKI